MKLHLFFLILICCSCSGQSSDLGNWKTEKANNQRTNYVNTNLPTKVPEVVWKKKISLASSPVVADGIVYFGDDENHFYAFDIANNKEIWKIKTASIVSSAVIDDNDIIYLAGIKNIIAIDRKTGEQLWNKEDNSLKAVLKIQDNILYLVDYYQTPEGFAHLTAFDTKTGNKLWSFSDLSNLDVPVINDGVLYIPKPSQSKFYALDSKTGNELWSIESKYRINPIISNGKIFLSSQSSVYAISEKNGTELWNYKLLHQDCSVVGVTDKIVYLASRNSVTQIIEIHALDLHTGEVKWKKTYESATIFTFAVANNNTLIFGINTLKEYLSGSAVLYALNSKNGTEIWQKKFNNIWINPEIIALNNAIIFKATQMNGLGNTNSDEYEGEYLYLLK